VVSNLKAGTVVRRIKIASLGELGRGSVVVGLDAQSLSRSSRSCCSSSGVIWRSAMVERMSRASFVVGFGRTSLGGASFEFEGLAKSKAVGVDLGERTSAAQLFNG
jgi:hypothetical protein